MAESAERKSYPMLSPRHWWTLRTRFRQSIPGIVTDSYLATVLAMEEPSARANVSPFLKAFGLTSSDGKPTELVKSWRDDESYASACKTILTTTYPDELIHVVDNVARDRPKVERWFQNKAGVGLPAAARMTSIFLVLLEADVSKAGGPREATSQKKLNSAVKKPLKQAAKERQLTPNGPSLVEPQRAQSETHRIMSNGPDVNINLQIHISADASPDQIDHIFMSIAKHLYKNDV